MIFEGHAAFFAASRASFAAAACAIKSIKDRKAQSARYLISFSKIGYSMPPNSK